MFPTLDVADLATCALEIAMSLRLLREDEFEPPAPPFVERYVDRESSQ